MNTEFTKLRDNEWLQGWVLYDGACPSCRRLARLTENLFTRRGFDVAPLQSPWLRECLEDVGPEPFSALRVITVEGQSFSGADALIFLAKRIWWARPLAAVALIPGVKPLLRRAYGWYALHRCVDQCKGITAPARERKAATPQAPGS